MLTSYAKFRHVTGMASRRSVSLAIIGIVALVHLVGPRRFLDPDWRTLYSSYFSDLVLPFAAYFLLCASEARLSWCKPWQVKLVFAIFVPAVAETAQYCGIPVLGSTFDPLDYCMYLVGALAAALVDVLIVTPLVARR